jgi:hypothetical protein
MSKPARIEAVIGASGSGKSAYVKLVALKRRPARLMVWDFKREYSDFGTVCGDIGKTIELTEGRGFAVVFQPSMSESLRVREFDLFCRLAYARANLCMVVEELAFVTRPSWAPDAWRMMTCTGRHGGVHIIGTSQRPAQVDKDFLGNATLIRCGRLGHRADVKVMSDLLFCDQRDLVALGDLEYIERRAGEKNNSSGRLKLPGKGKG